jgi:hypothetical protein
MGRHWELPYLESKCIAIPMHFKGHQQAKSNSKNKAPQFVRPPGTIVGS